MYLISNSESLQYTIVINYFTEQFGINTNNIEVFISNENYIISKEYYLILDFIC